MNLVGAEETGPHVVRLLREVLVALDHVARVESWTKSRLVNGLCFLCRRDRGFFQQELKDYLVCYE